MIKYKEVWRYAKLLVDEGRNNEYIFAQVEKHFNMKLNDVYAEALEDDIRTYTEDDDEDDEEEC